MKQFVTTLIVSICLPVLVFSQASAPEATDVSLPPVSVQAFGPGGVQADVVASPDLELSYYDPLIPRVVWQLPNNYGSFLNLYLTQRFTLPNNSAFLDSIAVRIDAINSGSVRIRVLRDTIINFATASFHFPTFTGILDEVTIPMNQITLGALTYVKLNNKIVGKEFHVSVEFTVAGGTNNIISVSSDAKEQPRRSLDKSRVIMVNQSGSNLQLRIMDSTFTLQSTGRFIFPQLYMSAFVDTATSSPKPLIVTPPQTNAYVDQPYLYNVHATGVPRPTYALLQGPTGMTIDQATGSLRWNPTSADVGDHTVSVRAENTNGMDDQTFSLSVIQATTPVITSFPKTKAIAGEPYFYQITATGGPKPTFRLSAGPQTMSVDPNTGQVRFNPTAADLGSIIVGVEALNAVGSDLQTYVLQIDPAASAPNITSTPVLTANLDQVYKYQVEASGNPQATFSLTKNPPGMMIDVNSGMLEWTASPEGMYEVIVKATNRVGSDEQTFNLTVRPGSTGPTITSTLKAVAVAGREFRDTIRATGVPTPTFHLVLAPGAMKLDSITGILTWTPERVDKGQYKITISARNPGGMDEKQFDLHVQAEPIITSSEKFTAEVGKLYQYQVVADAEPKPTFSLETSPTGMSIGAATGFVTWTPTAQQKGRHTVKIVATNPVGSTSQQYTIDVLDPTSVESDLALYGFSLLPNYPNPVSAGYGATAVTNVSYTLSGHSHVRIELRNVFGQSIAVLENSEQNAGTHTLVFDVRSLRSSLSAGTYFVVMNSGGGTLIRPMTVVR